MMIWFSMNSELGVFSIWMIGVDLLKQHSSCGHWLPRSSWVLDYWSPLHWCGWYLPDLKQAQPSVWGCKDQLYLVWLSYIIHTSPPDGVRVWRREELVIWGPNCHDKVSSFLTQDKQALLYSAILHLTCTDVSLVNVFALRLLTFDTHLPIPGIPGSH